MCRQGLDTTVSNYDNQGCLNTQARWIRKGKATTGGGLAWVDARLSRGRGSVNHQYPLLSETLTVWNGQICHQGCCAVTNPHTFKNQEL